MCATNHEQNIMNTSLRNLPIEQRLHLVEDLWDSIAADQAALPLSTAQRAELDRRLDDYEATGDPGRPAEQVLQDVLKRL
ncbi:MAG: addiction module protein [Rhodanobacteraceae bacterium]